MSRKTLIIIFVAACAVFVLAATRKYRLIMTQIASAYIGVAVRGSEELPKRRLGCSYRGVALSPERTSPSSAGMLGGDESTEYITSWAGKYSNYDDLSKDPIDVKNYSQTYSALIGGNFTVDWSDIITATKDKLDDKFEYVGSFFLEKIDDHSLKARVIGVSKADSSKYVKDGYGDITLSGGGAGPDKQWETPKHGTFHTHPRQDVPSVPSHSDIVSTILDIFDRRSFYSVIVDKFQLTAIRVSPDMYARFGTFTDKDLYRYAANILLTETNYAGQERVLVEDYLWRSGLQISRYFMSPTATRFLNTAVYKSPSGIVSKQIADLFKIIQSVDKK